MVFTCMDKWKFDSLDAMSLNHDEAWRSVFRKYSVPRKEGGGEYVVPVSALVEIYGEPVVDMLKYVGHAQGYSFIFKNYQGIECTSSFDTVLSVVCYLHSLHNWGIHLQMDVAVRERLVSAVKAIPLSDVLWLAEDGLTITEADLNGCLNGDWCCISKCLCAAMSTDADF